MHRQERCLVVDMIVVYFVLFVIQEYLFLHHQSIFTIQVYNHKRCSRLHTCFGSFVVLLHIFDRWVHCKTHQMYALAWGSLSEA